MNTPRPSFLLIVLMLALCVAGGTVGGAVAGWWVVDQRLSFGQQNGTPGQINATSTQTDGSAEVVPLEHRALSSSYPSFALRRLSSVLPLVKRVAGAGKTLEDRLIGPERTVGYGVAVTSDGWLVLPASVFVGVRAQDLLVVSNGVAYPIQKSFRDAATDLAYVKIDVRDLPVVAFLQPNDVVAGSPAWVEAVPQRFYPDLILDTRTEAGTVPVLSERATRRFLVSHSEQEEPGGAVWDSQGRLIGLLERRMEEGWRVLPVGTVSSAVNALSSQGVIKRSVLGLRAVSLSAAQFEEGRDTLSRQGVWVIGDKRTGLPAIVPGSPAVGLLREGDVIERIERDVLDGRADVGERLLDYRPGTKITLYGTRAGLPMQAIVSLGSATTSEIIK